MGRELLGGVVILGGNLIPLGSVRFLALESGGQVERELHQAPTPQGEDGQRQGFGVHDKIQLQDVEELDDVRGHGQIHEQQLRQRLTRQVIVGQKPAAQDHQQQGRLLDQVGPALLRNQASQLYVSKSMECYVRESTQRERRTGYDVMSRG